jgi:ABC-type lipoprotein export system ATPase subunit
MHIERMRVEEGFLTDIDLTFSQGLNVIIGARGTGKTSLIELIRFCLDAPNYTPESARRSSEHARSVLGSGEITLTLSDGERTVIVSRTASDSAPRASGPFLAPIMFSQTEIENVGLHASGRLRLIDGFTAERRQNDADETLAISEVQALSADIARMRAEIDGLESQFSELASIERQLGELEPHEKKLTQVSDAVAKRKTSLDLLSNEISASAVANTNAARLNDSLRRWSASVEAAISIGVNLDRNSIGGQADAFETVIERATNVTSQLVEAKVELSDLVSMTEVIASKENEKKILLESNARELRKEIETLQEGAGAIVSAGQQLRERKAQLESLQQIAASKQNDLLDIVASRNDAQQKLQIAREKRFSNRQKVVNELNQVLGPRIRATIMKGGQCEIYASAITELLRGSGLKYNDLAQQISRSVSPTELISLAEAQDFETLGKILSISSDRAAKVLAQVISADKGALATVLVEDSVNLQLLDGGTYKDIGDLSTGQRCAVVLPIVLRHTNRVLIVDQPEDHIDNAFIADTLIVSLLARDDDAQMLFSTHNANIPVLGNAERVVQLGSDGRRGFVSVHGGLLEPAVVLAISTIMEGGVQAFNRRAAFYGSALT